MSVANVLKALKGIYCGDQSDPDADLQDTFSDVMLTIPMIVDAAAGTDYTYGAFKAPFAFRVIEATICPRGALTAADATANTWTLAKADGAGGAATTIATLVGNLAGGDWVADVFKGMTLSVVAGAINVARGQLITLKKTHASTGTVTPAATLYLKVRKI